MCTKLNSQLIVKPVALGNRVELEFRIVGFLMDGEKLEKNPQK